MTITSDAQIDPSKLSDENIKNFNKEDKPEDGKKWVRHKIRNQSSSVVTLVKSFQGYDLYPERRGDKQERSWTNVLMGKEGTESIDKFKCEQNVYKCVKNSPLVKLMMGALKSSGCEVDIRRHISCEMCDVSVSGGYDPVLNQVVVCQNIAKSEGMVQGSDDI